LVLLLNQRRSPPLWVQVSACSTLGVTCDAQSIVAFCCESIECFPGTASKFFFKLFFLLFRWPQLLPMYTYIGYMPVHKLLYYIFVSAFLCVIFPSTGIFTSISMHAFSFYSLSQNCEKRLLASSCLSVCLSAWKNSALTGRIFMKFDIWVFFENLSKNSRTLHENQYTFLSYLAHFFLE
jgi:hypothetical protein